MDILRRIGAGLITIVVVLVLASSAQADPAWDSAGQAYVDGNGDVWMLWNYCGGCKINLTSATSAPAASPGNALSMLLRDGITHIFYLDGNNDVQVIYGSGTPSGSWSVANLSNAASAPAAVSGSALSSTIHYYDSQCLEYDQQYECIESFDLYQILIFYFDSDQHLVLLYDWYGSWYAADLTTSSSGPTAVSGSALSSLIDDYNTIRAFYFDSSNQKLYMVYPGCGNWCNVDMNSAAGGSPAAASVNGLTFTLGASNQIRLFYLGTSQHVWMLYNNCGANPPTYWCGADMHSVTGAATAASGSALTGVIDWGTNRIFFVDGSNNLRMIYDACGGSWCNADMNSATGGGHYVMSGSALSSLVDVGAGSGSAMHVFYFDSTNIDLWMIHSKCSGSWCAANISSATGAPSAASGSGSAATLR